MTNESEENARFVTCYCQHCNGSIEFDANELLGEALVVDCPHCHKGTVIFAPKTASPPPVIPTLFCRNCGKGVSPTTIACLSCGAAPRSQNSFCWHCGKPTTAVQIICVVCGVSLETPKAASPKVETPQQKSKLVAGLLAIFLGWLGLHKFYLDYSKEGLILLLVAIVGGFFTLTIAAWVIAVFALVEGFIYLSKSDQEFENTYVLNKRPWF
jgi:TM2 domain-containing membrane protein YozV